MVYDTYLYNIWRVLVDIAVVDIYIWSTYMYTTLTHIYTYLYNIMTYICTYLYNISRTCMTYGRRYLSIQHITYGIQHTYNIQHMTYIYDVWRMIRHASCPACRHVTMCVCVCMWVCECVRHMTYIYVYYIWRTYIYLYNIWRTYMAYGDDTYLYNIWRMVYNTHTTYMTCIVNMWRTSSTTRHMCGKR